MNSYYVNKTVYEPENSHKFYGRGASILGCSGLCEHQEVRAIRVDARIINHKTE